MIINRDGDLFVIKIFKNNIKNIDIFDIDDVSSLFKDILFKIKKKYDISGLCEIEVFVNDKFGIIIEINNIYKYADDEDIDIKIKFHLDCIFMNEIYNIDEASECYLYKDKYYSIYSKLVDSTVIYHECNKIIKEGIRVK